MRTRNEDKVQLVKQKAMEMLVADGLEGFSMNKLAKACSISVATLYIYYKDKDDLITQIGLEEGKRMADITMKDFTPDMSFAEGLRAQWKNRIKYVKGNSTGALFFEQLRGSTYQETVVQKITDEFRQVMGSFVINAVERGEIRVMPKEVYWSVAYGPLYSLLRFHQEGKSMVGHPFVLDEAIVWQTFDLIIKAFKP